MKRNTCLIAASTLLMAPLFLGAISPETDRPVGIRAMDWIRITENAGIALEGESRTDPLTGRFYVKQGTTWVEVSLQNSPRVIR